MGVDLRLIVAVVAVGLVAGVGLWSFATPADLPKAEEHSLSEVFPVNSKQWVDLLRCGSEISFRRSLVQSPEGGPDEVMSLKSLGRLGEDQEKGLVGALGLEASRRALADAMTKAESGAASDFVEFLKERHCLAKVQAAEAMVRFGDYITVPASSNIPPAPEGFLVLGQMNVGVVGGQPVDAWFFFDVDLERFAELGESKAVWEEAEAALTDDDVLAFNLLPMDERKAKIEASIEATGILGSSEAAQLTLKRRAALQAAVLPHKFSIDRARNLVVRRPFRRY